MNSLSDDYYTAIKTMVSLYHKGVKTFVQKSPKTYLDSSGSNGFLALPESKVSIFYQF